jgi:hypothetical protein
MQTNFEDLKRRVKDISCNTINNNFETNRSLAESLEFESDFGKKAKVTQRVKSIDNKLEEINTLGGRLYDKLLEKVNFLY